MKLFHVLTWTVLAQAVFSWDTNDLELFDLVEEVNQNFYEFLGVPSVSRTSYFSPNELTFISIIYLIICIVHNSIFSL